MDSPLAVPDVLENNNAPMTDEALIAVKDLVRLYGETRAVNGISFQVRRGEVLGFLGPNGAGKTTTMQIIAGTLAPTSGRVWVGNADVMMQPKKAKAQVGYLPEQPPVYRDLTVDEYLVYCARLHGVSRSTLKDTLANAKRRCGIESVGTRRIGNLSKGYQQRVGIAQAILHSPAVVILDEPTVGLDPIQIREIRDLIKELGEDHSVILSTHILPEVQAVCDRVIIINGGRLVLDDSLEHLSQHTEGGLRIGLGRPPGVDALRALPGVQRVEAIDEHHFLLFGRKTDQGTAEQVVQLAVSREWGLFELSPHNRSLEETFVQLTCGDADEKAAGGEDAA